MRTTRAEPPGTPDHPALPSLAAMGALIGDPVRAAILLSLSDGSRRPAGELAQRAGASPQAASAHLTRLLAGGLLAVETIGRHRFFRLASGEVAEMIEALANWTGRPPRPRVADPALARARLCYDHLAGRLGVALYEAMATRGWLALDADGASLSADGRAFCACHGLDPDVPRGSRRPALRLCLDWTERRHHLGGHIGAQIAGMILGAGHLRRCDGRRCLEITPGGRGFLAKTFGIDLAP